MLAPSVLLAVGERVVYSLRPRANGNLRCKKKLSPIFQIAPFGYLDAKFIARGVHGEYPTLRNLPSSPERAIAEDI